MKAEQNPALASQPEKPQHYTYLKEFRTQQCPLFLQHKCTQHRPYTCFHWHFANQRRRRPIRKRDGTFNYTPDTYCSKYDETTGVCPNGDECLLLHRNAGDTERRYHVRYYKTAICVHETDSKGVCTKNGIHCAFAHGTQDLRNPTYDVRELQALERGESPIDCAASIEMSTSMEKEKILNDDPKWNDSQYVLANYKTEPCKRPPRLCRQGYACPQYHNPKDRRRSPKVFKYRSTPCPQVKQHDEWGDPTICDNGDQCQYCHTRTEQQFYPEVYKSTKCKDMVQTGYCPRGPFCAFAHVDQEINMNKESSLDSPRPASVLASFIPSSLQEMSESGEDNNSVFSNSEDSKPQKSPPAELKAKINGRTDSPGREALPSPRTNTGSVRSLSSSFSEAVSNFGSSSQTSKPEPIGKGRSISMIEYHRSNSVSSNPGVRNGSIGADNGMFGPSLSSTDTNGVSSSLLDSGIGGFNTSSYMSSSSYQSASMSPFANPFYPPGDTVESVVGNALDDFNFGDFNHLSFNDDLLDQDRGDTASVCSSLSAGLASSYMSNSFTLPMSIPDARIQGSVGSLSQSPPASPLGSLPMGIPQQNRSSSVFSGQSRLSSLGTDLNPLISPCSQNAAQPQHQIPPHQQHHQNLLTTAVNQANGVFNSNLLTNGVVSNGNDLTVQKLKDEVNVYRYKLEKWEEAIGQARNACDAWKREAEDANRKYQIACEEKQMLLRQRDEAKEQASQLRRELDFVLNSSQSRFNKPGADLTGLAVNQLSNRRCQLLVELEQIQQLISKKSTTDFRATKILSNNAGLISQT